MPRNVPERPGVFERLFRRLRAEVLSGKWGLAQASPELVEGRDVPVPTFPVSVIYLPKKLRHQLIGLVLGAVGGRLPAGRR